jgi:hypothetical protein
LQPFGIIEPFDIFRKRPNSLLISGAAGNRAGDANRDGKRNIQDAALILQVAAGRKARF